MTRALILGLLVLSRSAFAQLPEWQGEYAQIRPGTRISLRADGPWLATPAKTSADVEVLDSTTPRVRFRVYVGGAQLLLYADRDRLQTFTLPGAELVPSESAAGKALADDSPGFKLNAGIPVEEVRPAGRGLMKVKIAWRGDSYHVEVRGFVPAAAIGKVFKASYVERPFAPDMMLPRDFRLLDAPGGKPFVFGHDPGGESAQVLDRKGKQALVRIERGAVGWIAAGELRPLLDVLDGAVGEENGVEGGVVGGMAGSTAETLPSRTVLYDAVDGQVVGMVGEGFQHKPSKLDSGWARFDLNTPYGTVAVWAHAPARPARPAP